MLEKGVNIAVTCCSLDSVLNMLDIGFSVVGFSQAEIGESRGVNFFRYQFVAFCNAQSNILFAEQRQDGLLEPARVAIFEAVELSTRQQLQKVRQNLAIGFEVRRELKEDGTQPMGIGQRSQRFKEPLHLFDTRLQPASVVARGLARNV